MNILFVVSQIGPLLADAQWVYDRLTGQGHTVTTILETSAAPSLTGKDLVIFGNGANVSNLGTKYDAATIGVLSLRQEPHSLYTTRTTGAGSQATQTQLGIIAAGDPLAAGLTGTPTITTVGGTEYYMLTTEMGSAAIVGVATVAAQSTRYGISHLEAGAALSDGSACPGRRAHAGLPTGYSNLNANGQAIFDAAVTWTAAGNHPPTDSAGADQTVGPGDTVTLSGAASDADAGDSVTVTWTQLSGAAVTLSDIHALNPTFTAPTLPDDSTLTFRLTATDTHGATATDDVTINVEAAANMKVRAGGVLVNKLLRRKSGGVLV